MNEERRDGRGRSPQLDEASEKARREQSHRAREELMKEAGRRATATATAEPRKLPKR